MKYLIVNADDFGYNPQQTKAIEELYTEGLISSTSVLTVAPDAQGACERASELHIPVGVHLTINSDSEENRWQSLTGAGSLSDEKGLYSDSLKLALRGRRREVAAELEAQYRFLTARGCRVDHADNHCGTLYGINGRRFYIEAYEFCAAHSLPYRFPKTPYFLERQLGRSVPKAVIALQRHIVREGEKRGVKMLDDLVSNPYSMERIKNYDELKNYYLRAVDNCIDGVTEMFLHPAYPVDGDREWEKRVMELKLLKSGDILQRAEDKGVKVVSWGIFSEI